MPKYIEANDPSARTLDIYDPKKEEDTETETESEEEI
jgi:hypothetical protein